MKIIEKEERIPEHVVTNFIYVAYELGGVAWVGIIVQCIITFVQLLFSMIVMQKVTGINAYIFFKNVVFHVSLVFSICLLGSFGCKYVIMLMGGHPIISILTSIVITTAICLFLGVNKNIRKKIFTIALNKIKK